MAGVTWITPVEITPSTTDAWVDIDLSSLIPEWSKGVILHVVNTSGSSGYYLGIRKNGSTDDRHNPIRYTSHHWESFGVDTNRILEIYIGNITYVDVYLVGYIGNAAYFYTNAPDISLSTTGAWTDIDLSLGDGAIGAIIEIYGNANSVGLRENGSTDNRPIYVVSTISAFIGVDNNEILEGYISDVGTKFYLTGYFKSAVVFLHNAIDLSLSTRYSYLDLAALPSGTTGGFIEVAVIGSSYAQGYALKKNGSIEDIRRATDRHNWAAIECDEDHIIEGYISNLEVDFFLSGYTYYEPVTEPTYSKINVWNVSAWIHPSSVKIYNGSSWVEVTAVKCWNGSSWVSV